MSDGWRSLGYRLNNWGMKSGVLIDKLCGLRCGLATVKEDGPC